MALDPCPDEIQRVCHLITTPDYRVQGFWVLLASVGMWVFCHFWAKETERSAWEAHEQEKAGRHVGINSHNFILVYAATRGMQVLAIASGLVGLSRLITGR